VRRRGGGQPRPSRPSAISNIPRDFPHFDYVDPNAPEGRHLLAGRAPAGCSIRNFQTFNSLNSYILKGDAAQGMELTFASLMARAGRRGRTACTGSRARRGAHFGGRA